MAVKEWFRRLQPVQLYLVLFFTTTFFVVEIVASHVTHSLTLLLNAYHMLCNVIALAGCIASIKSPSERSGKEREVRESEKPNRLVERARNVCNALLRKTTSAPNIEPPVSSTGFPSSRSRTKSSRIAHRRSGSGHRGNSSASSSRNSVICINNEDRGSTTSLSTKTKQSRSDRRMMNTFGWARIDVLTMLICCVFLASFCFSLLVEALQTLVHIDHLDEMHHPLPVLAIGASGILLNLFCYIVIGGYTFNQGIVLHVTMNGDVILRRNVDSQQTAEGGRQLTTQTRRSPLGIPKSQGFRETCRDVLGCVFVMLVSIMVYFTDSNVAKYIDPLFAFISAISLFILSYPYMKESGLILLQTIPNHINIDSLKRELLEAFPGIVNVHDLHVWQLTGQKIISTVHIIFLDPTVYASITDQVTEFFIEMGITQVTIQPEFHKMRPHMEKSGCLIRCHGERCSSSQCCTKEKFMEDSCSDVSVQKMQTINKKLEGDEVVPSVVDSRSSQSQNETTNRSSCRSNVEEPPTDKDDVVDSGVYAVNVDVNDQKCVTSDSNHEIQC
ncbi:zinc transporter 10 isoform X1 [Hylaeus volcanicus]|uniref:zinc transporter 10 isoform X1 n=1 Tax=Hylaeus volcanicus TaxID=313075 RepID=UPI0023B7F501|nr:zinc transporter 10 isoform X1 [Hylaeus volcanicus]XP_053989301.1 zinc transporter 10 isoform X1 [Hylaeus volcanicus]XP_053989302.1 zinc transporter 10 isoform X1 [Hylaeus volcanicus]XP_053989304.1 zinc transporter 10 isoform X1 [Hylaeus volcanicus]